jgi:hypothetical protein
MKVAKNTSMPLMIAIMTNTTRHSSRPSRRLFFEESLHAFKHLMQLLWHRVHLRGKRAQTDTS